MNQHATTYYTLRRGFLALGALLLVPLLSWGQVVISQVYGGGGNSGATYKNDFIELFNRGTASVDLTGWTIQYTTNTGTFSVAANTNFTSLSGTIAPGGYLLVQEQAGAGGTMNLPTPEISGNIPLAANNGKVALANNGAAVAGPTGSNVVDFVGFGTATAFEGSAAAPAPSNTTSILRANGGCTDTNQNGTDFSASADNNTFTPRNSSTAAYPCGAAAPTITTAAIAGSPFCVGTAGAPVSVSFTPSGTFGSGNSYTAYIGSTAIGSVANSSSGAAQTISGTIPSSIASGTTYRIRVDASNPATTGQDNGTNLTVVNYQTNNVTGFTATAGNAQATLTWTAPGSCFARTVVVASTSSTVTLPTGNPSASATYGSGDAVGSGFVVYNGAGSTATVTGLANGTQYYFNAFTTNEAGYSNGVQATATPVSTLTAAPTPLALTATQRGTPSAPSTYTLTGTNAGPGAVTVQAPAGFQVSLTSTFASVSDANALTFTPAASSFTQTLYVRLTALASGSQSGTITNTNGTLAASVAVSGTVSTSSVEPTAQPTIAVSNVGFSQADITLGGGNGQKRLVVIRPNTAMAVPPADNATYTPSSIYGSGSTTGASNFVLVAAAATTTLTVSGLSSSASYQLVVYAYNDDNVAGQENYLTTAPGTASFTTSAVPATFYAKAAGDLNLLSTFGTNPDGSGQAPPNFTTAGETYSVSGPGRTISAAWVVAGAGSKVVLATESSFTVPAAFNFTGLLDLQGTATLTVLHPAPALTLGTLAAASTVEYAQASGSYAVPAPSGSYGSLKLTNATKTFAAGTTTITGSLLVQNVTSLAGFAGSSDATYTTLVVSGDVTLLGTTVNPSSAVRFSLNLTGNGPKTLSSNGNTLRLFRLRTLSGSGPVSLADANGGTPLEAGSSNGGGVELYTNTTLALNANTLSFTPGGTAALNLEDSSLGTITASPQSSLNLENSASTLGFLSLTPGYSTLLNLRIANNSGVSLTLFDSDLTVNGVLNLASTTSALRINNHSLTLNGTVTGSGTLGGSTSSNLTIGGTGDLGILVFAAGSQTLQSLTLNRTGTVTLGSPLTLNGTLTLTNGLLLTTLTTMPTLTNSVSLVGGSDNSYVSGPLRRAVTSGNSRTIVFPIGKGASYRPLTLNIASQTSTTVYQAEQLEQDGGTTVTDPVQRVSHNRYFTVTPYNAAGTAITQPTGFNGTLKLTFGPTDRVTDPAAASLVVAKRASNAQPWGSTGLSTANTTTGTTATPSGTYASGTVTSASFTTFSDFILASTEADPTINPLPVQLSSFAATRLAQRGVALTWATASELNSARFEVERSADGRTFERVAVVTAAGTSAQARTYGAHDAAAPSAQLYYRLRLVDTDGTATHSPVAIVAAGDAGELALTPNPAHDQLSLFTKEATAYTVRNALGQPVLAGTTLAGAATSLAVSGLAAGIYFFELHGAAGRVVRRFVKE